MQKGQPLAGIAQCKGGNARWSVHHGARKEGGSDCASQRLGILSAEMTSDSEASLLEGSWRVPQL